MGDTPESDIRGTNEYNDSKVSNNEWYSILVCSGVHGQGTTPRFTPKATVDNVLEAVKHGMKREFSKTVQQETALARRESVVVEE